MNYKLIDTVTEWLDMQGYESEVDYEEEVIIFNENKVFCRLNERALFHIIEEHDMYKLEQIK